MKKKPVKRTVKYFEQITEYLADFMFFFIIISLDNGITLSFSLYCVLALKLTKFPFQH